MQKNKKIPEEQKAIIMARVGEGDCSIPEVAKLHGITRGAIYNWIRKGQKKEGNSGFIEVSVIDSKISKKVNLQKASVEFREFSLVIEGNVETSDLIKILQVLE